MNKVGAYVVHWRQDQKVWGSIPTIGHICRSVGQTSCHAASVGLVMGNGHLVEQKWNGSDWL